MYSSNRADIIQEYHEIACMDTVFGPTETLQHLLAESKSLHVLSCIGSVALKTQTCRMVSSIYPMPFKLSMCASKVVQAVAAWLHEKVEVAEASSSCLISVLLRYPVKLLKKRIGQRKTYLNCSSKDLNHQRTRLAHFATH